MLSASDAWRVIKLMLSSATGSRRTTTASLPTSTLSTTRASPTTACPTPGAAAASPLPRTPSSRRTTLFMRPAPTLGTCRVVDRLLGYGQRKSLRAHHVHSDNTNPRLFCSPARRVARRLTTRSRPGRPQAATPAPPRTTVSPSTPWSPGRATFSACRQRSRMR